MSLMDKITSYAKHMPNGIALTDGKNALTYGMLEKEILDKSRLLQSQDCKRLGIAGDNSMAWIIWDIAAQHAEIPCVPLPPFFTIAQTTHATHTAGLTHIANDTELQVIQTQESPAALPADTAKITFTSGSTGTPKGVCLTQQGMEDVAQSIAQALGASYAVLHFCALPLSVLLENVAGVYTALMMGATVHVASLAHIGMQNPFAPNFVTFAAAISASKATSIILVPELLRGLMAAVARDSIKLPHLKFIAVGGAKVAPELLEKAHALGLPVYEGYGLSECASVVSINTPMTSQTGSAGKLLPHIKAHILDGEIVIKNTSFAGYLGENTPPSTEWHTGDLGGIDQEGFITLHGRKKNVIITGYGRNISPEWIESRLLAQPEIAQAVVYGDGAAQIGALVVPTQKDISIEKAIARVNAGLPEYAQIGSFDIVTPFTSSNKLLTGNGRIVRHAILNTYGKDKTMTFFERLQNETKMQRQALYSVSQLTDALKGDISRDTYIAYLTEAFHHVKHTVRFMMAMGVRLPEEKKWLHDIISEYIDEEKGHEEWILNDIASAGGDKEAARNAAPNLETQVLVAYNYDYIARKNPIGFLGMVFMLESTSTQIATAGAEGIQKGLGLPKTAFTYLNSHGALDIEHMKFFEQLVNRIEDANDQAAIIEVAQNTFRLFAGVLSAIPHTKGAQRHAA